MKSLPTDLTLEIFSRLPSKSVARFRTLSKHWASVLRSPEFTKLFLTRSSTRPHLLLAVERYAYNEWHIFSTPQPQNRYEKSSHVEFHTKISGDVSRHKCSYGSGLIFFPAVMFLNENASLICNPITGMYVRLPDLTRYIKPRGFLGFDPIDKQIKVLCAANHSILTFGTGELSWRSNNTTIYYPSLTEGICINGVVYYLTQRVWEELSVIVCFDVRSEEFKIINAECFNDQLDDPTGLSLVNCKGKLGVIIRKYANASGRRTVELCMWVLEDVEKQEWVNYFYTLPENEVLGSCDFSVAGVTATGDIVLFMKFTCKPYYVFYFNPKRNTLKSVEIQGFGVNLESVEKRGEVYAYVDHVEDLSLNDSKQLKSSISQVKILCACCQQVVDTESEDRKR